MAHYKFASFLIIENKDDASFMSLNSICNTLEIELTRSISR